MPTDPAARPAGSALVDEVARAIRARIMSGRLAIGAQIRQVELAEELGVSRTPVREAIRQLQHGGLIDVVPNRGAVVRVPAPWEVREAYQVRGQLEGFACELAVRHIAAAQLELLRSANRTLREAPRVPSAPSAEDDAPTTSANDLFHATIHAAAGNQTLARAIEEINGAFPRNVVALVITDDPRHHDDGIVEHERIIEALESGDAVAARSRMITHVENGGEHLARWYERRSSTVFVG